MINSQLNALIKIQDEPVGNPFPVVGQVFE
jgi:hypothetical protein